MRCIFGSKNSKPTSGAPVRSAENSPGAAWNLASPNPGPLLKVGAVASQNSLPSVMKPEGAVEDFNKQTLLQQVKDGFYRRNIDNIKRCFEGYKHMAIGVVDAEKRKSLLMESLKPFNRANVHENKSLTVVLQNLDSKFYEVSFDEYKQVVSCPTSCESWAQSLPVVQLLADALPKGKTEEAQLKILSCLSDEQIDAVVDVYGCGLKRLLTASRDEIKACFSKAEIENQAASKFEVFTATCGSIADFHQGISGRIGEI
jgi:hypothetical protein